MAPDLAAASRNWRRLTFVGWIGYWLLLAILLHMQKPPRPPIQITRKGLVVHFTAFAVLALAGCVFRRAASRPIDRAFVVRWILIYAAFGGLSEWLQPLTGRHCDVWDWIADALGAAVALLIAWRWAGRPA